MIKLFNQNDNIVHVFQVTVPCKRLGINLNVFVDCSMSSCQQVRQNIEIALTQFYFKPSTQNIFTFL